MKTSILPKTSAGKWSVGLFASFIVLGIAGNLISNLQGNTIEYPNPINSPLLGTVIYLAFGCVMAASALGQAAVRKGRERSWLVYFSIPLGILFFIGIVILLTANLFGPPS